jgi:hypothetical protein
MSLVNIFDLSIKELGQIAQPNGTDPFRQSGVSLVWTPLPTLGVQILNIFTEKNHIFWNFCPYRKLLISESQFHYPSLTVDRGKEIHAKLTRVIHQAGHKKHSEFAAASLGSWTSRPEFSPPKGKQTAFTRLGGNRHFSLVMPSEDRPAVQNHFEQQARCFGNNSLIACPDTFDLLESQNLRGTFHDRIVSNPLQNANTQEHAWVYDTIRKYEVAEEFDRLIASLDFRIKVEGYIGLVPVTTRFAPFVNMEQFAEILRFRARVALAICPLPIINNKAIYLTSHGSPSSSESFKFPDGVREEMLEMFRARLEPYRTIIDFKLPSQINKYSKIWGNF